MTGNMSQNDFFSENDAFDINDLASLNEDISAEFIEQLQNNISLSVGSGVIATTDDSTLFEDITTATDESTTAVETEPKAAPNFDPQFDDNFIKKYQAKIKKQKLGIDITEEEEEEKPPIKESVSIPEEATVTAPPIIEPIVKEETVEEIAPTVEVNTDTAIKDIDTLPVKETKPNKKEKKTKNQISEIENLTSGNITEKPLTDDHLQYNESLDYLDDNVKYSKYVIYIDPENTEFMESLTVKERKNLINRIIREQDDIAITRKRLGLVQTFIKHSIVAIITIALAIPIIYHTINASLEASINNYRRSQSIFKTLYKEKGKIQKARTNIH